MGEQLLAQAADLVRIPDALDDEKVGASILQGLTVYYLIRQIHAVRPGDVLLVHALDCADPAAMARDIKQRYEKPLKEIFE